MNNLVLGFLPNGQLNDGSRFDFFHALESFGSSVVRRRRRRPQAERRQEIGFGHAFERKTPLRVPRSGGEDGGGGSGCEEGLRGGGGG